MREASRRVSLPAHDFVKSPLPFQESRSHICPKPTRVSPTSAGDGCARLRNVNAARGTPMKMPCICFARDPRKCERFRDKIARRLKIGGAIGRKTGVHFY